MSTFLVWVHHFHQKITYKQLQACNRPTSSSTSFFWTWQLRMYDIPTWSFSFEFNYILVGMWGYFANVHKPSGGLNHWLLVEPSVLVTICPLNLKLSAGPHQQLEQHLNKTSTPFPHVPPVGRIKPPNTHNFWCFMFLYKYQPYFRRRGSFIFVWPFSYPRRSHGTSFPDLQGVELLRDFIENALALFMHPLQGLLPPGSFLRSGGKTPVKSF